MFVTLRTLDDYMTEGTLATIDGKMNFTITDGYIQFLKLVLNQVPVEYGRQDAKWQTYLDKICQTAEKLQDKNTRFTGNTPEEFKTYCETVSKIMGKNVEPLPDLHLNIVRSNNLVPFIKEQIEKGNNKAFYYGLDENAQTMLMDELMKQLSGAKFNKPTHNYRVSNYLLSSGYHEEIHDALNIIIDMAVYAINCSSTREKGCYSFDTQKIHNQLRYAEYMIERIEHLI